MRKALMLLCLALLVCSSVQAVSPTTLIPSINAQWVGDVLHIFVANEGCLYLEGGGIITHLPDSCTVREYTLPLAGGDYAYAPFNKTVVQILPSGRVLRFPVPPRGQVWLPLVVGP